MDNTAEAEANSALINSFSEITSASKEEALFFLESHRWNLDSAVSTFLDNTSATATASATTNNNRIVNSRDRNRRPRPVSVSNSSSSSESLSPNYSPSPSQSPSPSRSRSRSPPPSATSPAPYRLRSRGKTPASTATAAAAARTKTTRGGIRTLAHLNEAPEASDDDNDEADYQPEQEYYTGGEKSGMLVQDPKRHYDADAIFDQVRQSGGLERPVNNLQSSSSSRSFTGTGRLLSGETVPSAPQPPEDVHHNVTLWRNGFTVDNGPLRRFDDPANASFLESIKKSECPLELQPADRRKTEVHLEIMRREENYSEPKKLPALFQGVGRTLGSSSDTATDPTSPRPLKAAPVPSIGLVVDSSLPTTSIQLRLADGTRMVSRFNLHHRIRDIRSFIEASRPGGGRNYELQTVGFPPKQLSDPEQTIEDAGIANSVVIQKF